MNEDGSDSRSYEHYLVVEEIKPKKLQTCVGLEPMTSTIPMQCSTNWANKPNGSWWFCGLVKNINPWVMNRNIWNHICHGFDSRLSLNFFSLYYHWCSNDVWKVCSAMLDSPHCCSRFEVEQLKQSCVSLFPRIQCIFKILLRDRFRSQQLHWITSLIWLGDSTRTTALCRYWQPTLSKLHKTKLTIKYACAELRWADRYISFVEQRTKR